MIGNVGSSVWSTLSQTQSAQRPPTKPDAESMFATLDADGDGEVTSTELSAVFGSEDSDSVTALMSSMDSDESGSISQSELSDSIESVLSQLREQASAQGMPPPPPPAEEEFAAMDADGDGSISVDELSSAFAARAEATGETGPSAEDFLARFDSDGDGALSEAELAEAHQPPPGPPPEAASESAEGLDQEFVATVLNLYMSNLGLGEATESSIVTSA